MSAEPLTLTDARGWLRDRVDEGAECPCCTQFAKVYRRKINSGMARALITLWHKAGRDYVHLNSTVSAISHEAAQLSWWGLIEQDPEIEREDGGRSSFWRITPLGVAWLHNRCTVPKYARVYNGRVLSMIESESHSIVDALGTRFDYAELMAGL